MTARFHSLTYPAAVAAVGLITLYLAMNVERLGTRTTMVAPAALAIFALAVLGWVHRPWVMAPIAVLLFSALAPITAFALPGAGGSKDLLVAAAAIAGCILLLQRRREGRSSGADRVLVTAVVMFVGLYIISAGGGGHGAAWFHSTRLLSSGLVLLVFALLLENPRRTLHAAAVAVVAVGVVNAVYGLIQQAMGWQRLLDMGYVFGREVRLLPGGTLRSFGTFDQPFSYATVLLISLTVLLLHFRWRAWTWPLAGLLIAGITVSFVRTAFVCLAAVLAIVLASRGKQALALFILAVTLAFAALTLAGNDARQTTVVQDGQGSQITLNGRVGVWATVLGKPSEWAFGKGPGVVGVGVERAGQSLSGTQVSAATGASGSTRAVDSAYLATIADVGLVGLGVLAVILTRIGVLARRGVRAGAPDAWLTAGLLGVMVVDATTRATFSSFPGAYVGFLFVGLSIAAAARSARRPSALPPSLRRVPA